MQWCITSLEFSPRITHTSLIAVSVTGAFPETSSDGNCDDKVLNCALTLMCPNTLNL